MYMQDPAQLLALHRAIHSDLIADARVTRSHRARSRARIRQISRRAYYRWLRRMRALRAATALPSRVTP